MTECIGGFINGGVTEFRNQKATVFTEVNINNLCNCRGVVVQNWPVQNYFYRRKVCLQQTTNIQQIKYAPSIFQEFVIRLGTY